MSLPEMTPEQELDAVLDMTDVQEMYDYVHQVYYDYSGNECSTVDYWLLTQGRCLWMRREEGEIWTPPS